MIDDRLWLRFDDRQFAVGDLIRPTGFGPDYWQDPRQRDQFCSDRVYIVRAASPDRLPHSSWNDPGRWCYQVAPKLPVERDRDRSHRDVFDSWMCQSAIVVQVLRAPRAA